MEDAIREIPSPCLLARDLNARVRDWGMPLADTSGHLLFEMASRLGLWMMNEENTLSYRTFRFGELIPGGTLISDVLAS